MALFNIDCEKELNQVTSATKEIVEGQLSPLIEKTINHASGEIGCIISQAGKLIQDNIKVLSDEVHNQRQITKEDIKILIDYASDKIGSTVDQRISQAKNELSTLLTDKILQIRAELEDTAIKSRKTLYFNLAISLASAVLMAGVGIVYRKISIGELDIFNVFRVLLLSSATGTGVFSGLKMLNQWRIINKDKRNIAITAINYLGVLRPNGAFGLFALSILLFACWFLASFYK